ncbi:MAG: diguanylate cyclase [Gammaproteobacteria bacterium]
MTLRLACLSVLAALVLAPPANAEHCPDVAALAGEIAAMRDSNPADGVLQGEAAISALRDAGHRCDVEEARLRGAVGTNLNMLGRNDEAVAAFDAALALVDEQTDATLRASLHRGAGLAHYDSGSFDATLPHYLASLRASEEAGDAVEAAKTSANIGILYVTLGALDSAREYHERALHGFEEAGFKPGIAGTLINLGALAAKFALRAAEDGDTDAAQGFNQELRQHNERALDLFAELGNARGVAYAASNVGLAHDRLGEPAAALEYHEQSLAARREIGDAHGTINSLSSMAASLTALGRYDAADARLAEAESLLPPENPRLALTVYEPWAELEEARGDLEAALARHRQIAEIREGIAASDLQAQIADIQARYDTEQQRRKIDELEFERTVTDMRLERQQVMLIGGTVVVVLLLLLLAAMGKSQRMARRHAQEMERAARTDELTGLANRREARERVEYEIRRTRRSGRPFSLALIDVDGFKAVNDAYGHAVGDRLLIEVARRIERSLRRQDTLARWGGDELLLLLPETSEQGAGVLARKIVEGFPVEPVSVGGVSHRLTLTAGVAQYWPGSSVDEVVRAADDAMYRGKRAGKNKVTISREG